MELEKVFNEKLAFNYHLYKSILLTLPFSRIEHYGILLSVFSNTCIADLKSGKNPEEIVDSFIKEQMNSNSYLKDELGKERNTILFKFIQFIERQVTIFDSLEDAYFSELNPVNGEGTLNYFFNLVNSEWKYMAMFKKIEDFKIRIVLTAHPTQFYSVHILGLLRRLTKAIKKKDNIEVRRLFKQLGKTNFYNREKITPIQEVKSILVFLERVFYHQLPHIEDKIEKQISSYLGENHEVPPLPNFIQIGFWPGGDRDGNPFVTHETTREAARLLRSAIISCYLKDLKKLQSLFTFEGIYETVKNIRKKIFRTLRSSAMTLVPGQSGKSSSSEEMYNSFEEFSKDLTMFRKLLIDEHEALFLEDLDFFIRKTKCFGFYFASIDIRQDSQVYERVIYEIANLQFSFNYEEANDRDKILFLLRQGKGKIGQDEDLLSGLIKSSKLSDEAMEVLKTVAISLEIQKENGIKALHRYIISNTYSIFSVLQVGFLFSLTGRVWGKLDLDIIPLFETMDDLKESAKIMQDLYQISEYRRQISYRQDNQVVMLGFSDGTKDGGYIAANWAILEAKERITEISRNYGIKVIFFDGRGGPPARGGGETNKFYSSLGKQVENHEIQLTVQGQTISSKYGNDQSFCYNIEQLLVAGLEGHLFDHKQNRLNQEQRELLQEMGKLSFVSYSKLKGHARFIDYLNDASPMRFYSEANIGSRPSKRVKEGTLNLDNLRAIPFVSSWSQMKQNIPAYYGMGTALKTLDNRGDWDKVSNLFRESAFFRTLINNSIQALEKTDLNYTRHLCDDPHVGEVWCLIEKETILSKEMIRKLSGKKYFFSKNDINRYSISFREGIVAPLVVIQQYALIRLLKDRRGIRKISDDERKILEKIVIRSMPGLINASRNSA